MTPGAGAALGVAIGRLLALLLDLYDQDDPAVALQAEIRALEVMVRIKQEARRTHALRRASQ